MSPERIPKELLGKWGGPALAQGWTNIPNTLLDQQSKLDLTNSEMMLLDFKNQREKRGTR